MMRFAVAFGVAHAGALEWQQLPDAPWSARSDTCAGITKNEIVIAGGHANSAYTNDVWSSPDAGVSWNQVVANGTAIWSPRSYHTCVILPGNRMLLIGGHAQTSWYNDVWISGPDDFSNWTQLLEHAPWQARAAANLQYQSSTGKLFYMGGSDGLLPPAGFGTTIFNDVWVSSDEGASWELATAQAPWAAREGFTGQSSGMDIVIGGSSLTVMGGENGYLPWGYFGDVWSSEDGATWVQRREKAEWAGFSSRSIWNLKGRSGHIVASEQKNDGTTTLWLSGGYLGRSDVWCLSGVQTAADLERPWTRVSKSSPWAGRYDHVMAVVDKKLIMFSGENSAAGIGGPYYNDVWSADLEDCPTTSEVQV